MKQKTFSLKNKNGMKMEVSNLGGSVTELMVPDRDGNLGDVLLSCADIADNYANGYMSALIGRVCGRIGKGKFKLDGTTYEVPLNSEKDGVKCALHGGNVGFDRKIWDVREMETPEGPALELSYLSRDGEEGFPGNLSVRVVYTLMECNAWRLQYWAVTDAPTVVNLTHHAYFNLACGARDVLDHVVWMNCSRYTPTDAGLVPTGKVLPVAGTPVDFTEPRRVGDGIDSKAAVIRNSLGYDHNFLIDRSGPGVVPAAAVWDECSGRQMEVFTTEPCLQFYSANFLVPGIKGKRGAVYGPRYGLCFETQHVPDAPNLPGFDGIRLNPGEVMQSTTIYQFSTDADE